MIIDIDGDERAVILRAIGALDVRTRGEADLVGSIRAKLRMSRTCRSSRATSRTGSTTSASVATTPTKRAPAASLTPTGPACACCGRRRTVRSPRRVRAYRIASSRPRRAHGRPSLIRHAPFGFALAATCQTHSRSSEAGPV